MEELLGPDIAEMLTHRTGKICCCMDEDVKDILSDMLFHTTDEMEHDIYKLEKSIEVKQAMDDLDAEDVEHIEFAKQLVKSNEANLKAYNDLRKRIKDTPTCEYLERTGDIPTDCKI